MLEWEGVFWGAHIGQFLHEKFLKTVSTPTKAIKVKKFPKVRSQSLSGHHNIVPQDEQDLMHI